MHRRSLLALCILGACAAPERPRETPAASLPTDISCVPFARALSGIALAGDAHLWWAAADGRYARGREPVPGAVLVIGRSRSLPQGHLAVVVGRVGQREILVTHANWGTGRERGRVTENQRVVDVSRRNDWTAVRVWHPPSDTLGVTVYQARGFILPPQAADPARLAALVPTAAWAAAGTL
jgi:hypothetical protein